MPVAMPDARPDRLRLDDLTYAVRWSAQRRSVGITVDRDGSLLLHAPEGTPLASLEAWARGKRMWVLSKLAEKELLAPRQPEREFVSGEGFDYLGRRYRLRLDGDEPGVRFTKGRILMNPRIARSPRAGEAMSAWYAERAQVWLPKRLRPWTERMALRPAGLRIRDLGFRWGSLGKQSHLNLHWATMQLPPSIIDYVMVHELAHLAVPDHSLEFWERVAQVMPDYERRKERLAEFGARLWLG